MKLLICQFTIRQWDKSQATAAHVAARAALPDRYAVVAEPCYRVADTPCIIEQHGDDLPTSAYKEGRIKCAQAADRGLRIDRFQLSLRKDNFMLDYLAKDSVPREIGVLDRNWIRCRYSWRYGVEESGQYYWMYEEVILNAACLDVFDAHCFLNSEPGLVFHDA